MTVEIRVGPPVITISQGRTFMVTTQAGEIRPDSDQGIYAIDTRFISFYQLYINRIPLKVINSSQLTFYAARYHLTNPGINMEGGVIKENSLSLTINRTVSEGIHEEVEVLNYSGNKVVFLLELALQSDFADIFEVKAHDIVQRGQTESVWDKKERQLRTSYDNQDFHRSAVYKVTNLPDQTAVGYANGRIFFQIELEHNQSWQMCADLMLEHGKETKKPQPGSCSFGQQGTSSGGATPSPTQEPRSDFDARQALWQERCTRIATSSHNLQRMYTQAILDMGALRIYDMDVSDEAWVPAAGVPWFVTLFGRDSLTVSYQNMAVSPGFARGALKRLAEHQAKERDDWLDAQPGKISHEMRFGELAHFHKIPFYPYYGTADATILYLIVLSETYRWTGDVELLKEYREVAENCLKWIDESGDLDGDGFQEYKTFSSLGYANIGWKDASNAVVYADGSQVKQPKGVCTLQGYVYDPLDYQNGSVWPQDNGIIAAGFKRYGLVKEANQVIRALLDAIERFDAYRPPEVFAGLKRKGDMDFPVLYPGGANIPQAWATGSIFHMVRTMLGLRADAPHKRLYVHPTLPNWLPDLELQSLRVGPCQVTIRFWREGTLSRWEVREVARDQGVKAEDTIQVMDDPDVVQHESH